MTFEHALGELRDGRKVARSGWNGKDMFLFYVDRWNHPYSHELDLTSLPFIAIKTVDDKVVPWSASQTDLLAEDWIDVV